MIYCKLKFRNCFFLLVLNLFVLVAGAQSPVDYVRPQIDSHKSRWFYFSPAVRDGEFESGYVGEGFLEFGLPV